MIDINAKTTGWNIEHSDWYADNVHFNSTGYTQLTKLFYEEFWDTTVHDFTVEGVETENIKVDNVTGTVSVAGTDLDGSATVTVADKSKVNDATGEASVALSEGSTFTVTAPRDDLSKTYTIRLVEDASDLEKTLIYNADQLKALQGKALDGDYKLMADINLGEVTWTPITSLTGTFDGNGKTITMTNTVSANNYGFIKTINADSTLKNLTIDGSVNGGGFECIGAFVYENKGIIQSCYNQATMTNVGTYKSDAPEKGGSARTAGIVALNYGLVNNCANMADISGGGDYIGGIVGVAKSANSVVANCYNTGNITNGWNGTGGIVADAYDAINGKAGSTVINCYNTGAITANKMCGGITANGCNSTYINCWSTGTRTAPNGESGDICGRVSTTTQTNNFGANATAADTVTALNNNLLVGANYNGTLYDLNEWTQNDGVPSFTGATVTAMPQDENGAYHLLNEDHFNWWVTAVKADASVSAVLECDIPLSGEWTPIANLTGTFDGNGHTISGLTITDATTACQGFFADVTGGTVKNLNLTNVSISSSNTKVGGIAGRVRYGTISNCTVSGTIADTHDGGSSNIGGIVGEAGGNTSNKVLIEDCVNNAAVTITHATKADKNVGGIVGQGANAAYGSVIRNCVNNGVITGDITYSKKIAGIAGETYYSIVNCVNTGSVSGFEDIGGIVGVSYNGNNPNGEVIEESNVDDYDWQTYVVNCYNTGIITGSGNQGGIAGRVNMYSHMYNCYTTGTYGVYAGVQTVANTANNYYCSDTAAGSKNGTGKTAADMQTADFVRLLNNYVITARDDAALGAFSLSKWAKGTNNYPVHTGKTASADEVVDNSSIIETAAQLLALNGKTGDYTLANDITVTTADATAAGISETTYHLAGAFNGKLNGAGYTVTVECNRALFNSIGTGAEVKNLTLDGSFNQETVATMAALVFNCKGTVDNCDVAKTAVVKGKWRTGGLVSNLQDGGVVKNCTVSATVGGADQQVGGVVGYVYSNATATIQNCTFDGAVNYTGTNGHVGGILAYTEGDTTNLTVKDCTFSGTVTSAGKYAGGIVGSVESKSSNITFSNCVSSGSVTGVQAVGGVAGRGLGTFENCRTTSKATVVATTTSNPLAGGIVGQVNKSDALTTLRNCVNEATVTASHDFCGGMVALIESGTNVVIDGCTNNGTLNGTNATGGLVGCVQGASTLTIANSQNTGAVNGAKYTAGLVGLAQEESTLLYIVNSRSVGTVTGSSSSEQAGLVQMIRNGTEAHLENSYLYNAVDMAAFTNGTPTTSTVNADTVYAWRSSAGTHANGYQMVTDATMKSAGFVLTLDNYTPSETMQAVLTANNITLKTWEYVSGATPVLGKEAIGSKGGIQQEEDGTLLIGNELQLFYFASNSSTSARLTADIALTNDWTTITTAYSGTFDGDGHTISGFKQVGQTTGNVGMFKELATAGAIKNLTLEGSIDCNGANTFGAFVATNNGTVEGCINKVNIADLDEDGNVIRDDNGYVKTGGGGTTAGANIGGVVGLNKGTINSCGNEAVVSAEWGDNVGGIAGKGEKGSLIVNSYNSGEVAHANPDFSSQGKGSGTGGILGGGTTESSTATDAGATATFSSEVWVINCYNTGSVYDNNNHRGYVGGIIGDRGYAYNCYNTGRVWYYNGTTESSRNGIGGRGNADVQATIFDPDYCYSDKDKVANADDMNGTRMTGDDMQATDFVAKLNENVDTLPTDSLSYTNVPGKLDGADVKVGCTIDYGTLLKNVITDKGVTLKYWAHNGNNLPVLVDQIAVNIQVKNMTVTTKYVSSPTALAALLDDPNAPDLGGYTFIKWSDDVDNAPVLFAAGKDGLTIVAVYEVDSTAKTYTVETENAVITNTTDEKFSFDQKIVVEANFTEGEEIAYWELDGAKVGFKQDTYTFYVSGNSTIKAISTDKEEEITAEVVLQQATYSTNDGKFNLTVIAQTSIPEGEGYTVVSYGVYYTAKEEAILNLPDGGASIRVASSKTAANEQYMTHLLSVAAGRTRYARAYVEYMDANGATHIQYSDTYVKFQTPANTEDEMIAEKRDATQSNAE